MDLSKYSDDALKGTIITDRKRCYKPTCHCNGRFKHKANYLYYREHEPEGWKLKKKYIKKSDVYQLKKEIKYHKQDEQEWRKALKIIDIFIKYNKNSSNLR